MNKHLKTILLYVSVVIYLAAIFQWGWMGFWVGFLLAICFVIVRIVFSWNEFMSQIEILESILFGKPLIKKYWQGAKPKLPKVKWKKKK